MNLVDIVIFLIIFFFALEGFGKPLFFELSNLFGFIAAFFISLKFYNAAARELEKIFSFPHSFANVLGFIFIWYLIEVCMYLFARLIYRRVTVRFPGERFLSIFPAILRGVIFISIFLILLATFPIQPRIKKEVDNSVIGSFLLAKTYQLEMPLKNVFGGLANDTLAFLTIKPEGNESVNLGFQTDGFTFDPGQESNMIDLVNKERIKVGLDSLIYDPVLQEAAREHSADMLKRGYFSHYSPEGKDVADRITALGVSYLVVGENLAFAPNLQVAHEGLMNSPGHRANILSSDYHMIGIGVAKSSDYGLMITQVFKN